MQISRATLVIASLVAVGLCTSGCNNENTNNSKNNRSQTTAVKKQEAQIVGSYRDEADGAAITLNSDGTGTYVMANPTKADIHDQLTWKKEKNNYIINLNDSNYDTPINAQLNEDNLSLAGDEQWPRQSFRRVRGEFNVDDFLTEQHAKENSASTTKSVQPKESSTHARTVLKKWAQDHHRDSQKIDHLKATTDLSEPDEGWAFVDDNGTEYAIVRNGKVYPRPVLDNDASTN